MTTVLLIAATSYLLGSIPFGYILVRIFRGEDVRRSGSGNIGATNVARKSPALGVLTLLLDALKGSAAVFLAANLSRQHANYTNLYSMISLAALCAIAGHLFPIWLKFRGGKGVATGLGSFIMIAPKAVLISVVIFVVLVLLFRYISLGSIIAVAAFPVFLRVLHQYGDSWLAVLFTALSSLLIIGKHHQNIRRLLAGTENCLGAKRV
ncbi:MAG TPA: glycerol-3-phosphate 1-O-acyltransferase PlsY [Candidatus Sulfotelmatobacter sp.]|nr:glycerol-3-phosphate 1-O-acyltransferase PlsY [Candidatus Sulfotelmatobacter sp.]